MVVVPITVAEDVTDGWDEEGWWPCDGCVSKACELASTCTEPTASARGCGIRQRATRTDGGLTRWSSAPITLLIARQRGRHKEKHHKPVPDTRNLTEEEQEVEDDAVREYMDGLKWGGLCHAWV